MFSGSGYDVSAPFGSELAMSSESFTQLLQRCRGGESTALEHLLPHVYEELRRLAQAQMRRAQDANTLQPTALVHEAYLRMVDQEVAGLEDRTHFYGLCARVMRQILVDRARRRNSAKRGAGAVQQMVTGWTAADGDATDVVDVVAFHEALEKLAALDERRAQVVELKTFSGLTMDQVAEVLGVSKRTVEADWFFARAWLRSALS